MATSMAINASNAQPWPEGVSIPASQPNSGTMSLAVGVGRLPAVNTIVQRMSKGWSDVQKIPSAVPSGVPVGTGSCVLVLGAHLVFFLRALREHFLSPLPKHVHSGFCVPVH